MRIDEDSSDWMSDDEGDTWDSMATPGCKYQPKDLRTLLTHTMYLSDSVAKLAVEHFTKNPLGGQPFVGDLKKECTTKSGNGSMSNSFSANTRNLIRNLGSVASYVGDITQSI